VNWKHRPRAYKLRGLWKISSREIMGQKKLGGYWAYAVTSDKWWFESGFWSLQKRSSKSNLISIEDSTAKIKRNKGFFLDNIFDDCLVTKNPQSGRKYFGFAKHRLNTENIHVMITTKIGFWGIFTRAKFLWKQEISWSWKNNQFDSSSKEHMPFANRLQYLRERLFPIKLLESGLGLRVTIRVGGLKSE